MRRARAADALRDAGRLRADRGGRPRYASIHSVHPVAIVLAAGTIVLVLARTGVTFRENTRLLERSRTESLTDSLTGLGNRRKLVADLEAHLDRADRERSHLLVVFDLNGFKGYNDRFGHPAGDALLARLARKLRDAVEPDGIRVPDGRRRVLRPDSRVGDALHRAASALYEEGESFVVSSAFGAVTLPDEASEPSAALSLSDQRLYAHKDQLAAGRGSPHELLMRTLAEREPELRAHVDGVARLAVAVGRRLGLGANELGAAAGRGAARRRQARDPGRRPAEGRPADRRGVEVHPPAHADRAADPRRCAGAAPGRRDRALDARALGRQGLRRRPRRTMQIPVASRVIAACDAFSAMTAGRPYGDVADRAQAIAELRRCSGSQFDPAVVLVLCDVLEQNLDLEEDPALPVSAPEPAS